MLTMVTDSTCADACWHAREEVCRCSCGGRNHGILLTAGGERPARTAKIDGERYRLEAVGLAGELIASAKMLNDAAGVTDPWASTRRQHYGETPVAIVRPTNASQRKWTEVAPLLPDPSKYECAAEWLPLMPQLLWVRTEVGV